MDLETRKITFVQEFLRLQNEEIISGLEHLLREKKAEQIDQSLTPMSIDQFNFEIDQSMKDSADGRLTPAKDLKKKTRKWS
jgi:hypothetical protein